MNKLSEVFVSADLADFPPLTAYDGDRLKVLWTLWVGKERLDLPWLTPGQIEEILRDGYGVLIPRQRIPGLLTGSATARRRVSGRYAYQLMRDGVAELQVAPENVTFIDPAQALSRIREVEALLRETKGTVSLCDPYVDGRTLDFLAECSSATGVRLLTVNINKLAPFKRDLAAFRRQHPSLPIEVKTAPQGVLHDRYLIDDSVMLIFGTSLNSLGRKQSFVISAGEDVRRVVAAEFDRIWFQSTLVT